MEDKFYVTEEGLAELNKELENLIHVELEQVKQELKDARAQGDLSENADYDAAKDHEARVNARIKELDYQIKHAEIISNKRKSNTVRIGSTVEIEELDTKASRKYKIVGTVEADPINGNLSNETPLAKAIIDHKVNDICTVEVKNPYQVKITKIA